MLRRKTCAAAILMGLALPAPGFAEEEKVLNVYNWSIYVAPDTIAEFERETGISVNYDVFDSNEVLEAKLLAGRSNYDIVVPTAAFLERQIRADIFQPLDKQALTQYGNLDAELLARVAENDAGNAHAVPYMWGTIGIGYDRDKVAERLGGEITSWEALFKPENAAKLADCGIAVLDSPSEVVGTVLAYLGLDPNSEEKADLEKATGVLAGLRPFVKYFHSSQYINDLAGGSVCVAIGYNGDILQAQTRAQESNNGVNVAFSVPEEGAVMWFDVMAVPRDAPHPQNAHLFLDYILRPEVAAKITDTVRFANANAKATELVDPAIRDDAGTYPPASVREGLSAMKAHSVRFDRQLTVIGDHMILLWLNSLTNVSDECSTA